jgi:hypothetical protein
MKVSSLLTGAAIAAATSLLFSGASRADSFQFSLTSDHCSGTGGCLGGATSAGTITITDISSGVVSVDVTLASAFKFVATGFDTDFGFNLAGNPSITFSNVSTGFTPNANPETAGSLHMDGTGFFEYGVNCTACGNGGSNPQSGPLDFRISGTGVSAASFEQNAAGQFFAADLLGNGNTGAVDASVRVAAVPGPIVGAGLPGLVVACGGLIGLARRRRQRLA